MTFDDMKSIADSENTSSMQSTRKDISLRMEYAKVAGRQPLAASPALHKQFRM